MKRARTGRQRGRPSEQASSILDDDCFGFLAVGAAKQSLFVIWAVRLHQDDAHDVAALGALVACRGRRRDGCCSVFDIWLLLLRRDRHSSVTNAPDVPVSAMDDRLRRVA